MPANLTPIYRAAEEKYREAETPEERLAALEEMLSTIPKHKGTEKMQADIKKRISRTKDEILQGKKAGARQKISHTVRREGAGQMALVGPANAGKSALLAAVSKADPEVADYPFTTQTAQPGMVRWENVQVQVIDLPPFDAELSPTWLSGTVRSADGLVLVFSLGTDDLLTEAEDTLNLLEKKSTWLTPASAPAGLEPGLVGKRSLAEPHLPPPDPDDERPLPKRWPAFIVATKLDAPGASDRLSLLTEVCPALPIVPVSVTTELGLSEFRAWLFSALDKIRVYTRAPGKKPDLDAPFVIPKKSTILEAAAAVHKDFARNLKAARVWSDRTFDGQAVPRDYLLEDGDIIELRM